MVRWSLNGTTRTRRKVRDSAAIGGSRPSTKRAPDLRRRFYTRLAKVNYSESGHGCVSVTMVAPVLEPRGAFHPLDDRIKRALAVSGRAEIPQKSVRFDADLPKQRNRKPRLADAALSRERHHLAVVALGALPTPQQKIGFLFASNQGGEFRRMASKRLSTALSRSTAKARTGLANPLSSCCPRSRSSKRFPRSLEVFACSLQSPPCPAPRWPATARRGWASRRRPLAPERPPRRGDRRRRPTRSRSRTCKAAPAAVSSFGTASTRESPAWTARSASCSCARG